MCEHGDSLWAVVNVVIVLLRPLLVENFLTILRNSFFLKKKICMQ
jgi:hypothetical protein